MNDLLFYDHNKKHSCLTSYLRKLGSIGKARCTADLVLKDTRIYQDKKLFPRLWLSERKEHVGRKGDSSRTRADHSFISCVRNLRSQALSWPERPRAEGRFTSTIPVA